MALDEALLVDDTPKMGEEGHPAGKATLAIVAHVAV
jgi:hypothetical protein